MNAVVNLGGSETTAPRSNFANMQSTPALHNTAVHMPAMQYIIACCEMRRRFNVCAEDAEL